MCKIFKIAHNRIPHYDEWRCEHYIAYGGKREGNP
jgi:hypothetical protein